MKSISPRITFLGIFALFVGPLLLAWLMYAGQVDFEPDETRNKGNLVEPPLPLPVERSATGADDPWQSSLLNHWVVLYPISSPCGASCIEQVTGLRQLHRASGRDQPRIRIALLQSSSADQLLESRLKEIYPQFVLVRDTDNLLHEALAQASQQVGVKSDVFLVDPLGNVMMSYPETEMLNHLKSDLKQLLKWSKQDQGS